MFCEFTILEIECTIQKPTKYPDTDSPLSRLGKAISGRQNRTLSKTGHRPIPHTFFFPEITQPINFHNNPCCLNAIQLTLICIILIER